MPWSLLERHNIVTAILEGERAFCADCIHGYLESDLVSAGKSVAQAARHLGIGRSTAYKVIKSSSTAQTLSESSPLE